MFWCVISRNRLLVAGGRAVETSPIFVFRMTFYVHRGSGQARVYPRRWLSLSGRANAFTLKGRHRRFVGDSAFHRSLQGTPLLVGEQQNLKWYHQILQKVQNLMPHDYYLESCTLYTIVHQYVLVSSNFWCKYSSRSLYYSPKQEALVPVTINAPRRYRRPSNHSSPSDPLSPGGASFKVVEFWSQ